MESAHVYLLATLAVALVAGAFDWKTGRVPNLLTLSGIVLAFPLHAYVSGSRGVLEALQWPLLGAVVCGLPSALVWRLGWLGGGDVKLIAMMGAMAGLSLGVECVFLALLSASAFALLRLAWSVAPRAELRSALRFGPFAFVGTALAAAIHGGFG
jgi:prepilin peptidase CpaA